MTKHNGKNSSINTKKQQEKVEPQEIDLIQGLTAEKLVEVLTTPRAENTLSYSLDGLFGNYSEENLNNNFIKGVAEIGTQVDWFAGVLKKLNKDPEYAKAVSLGMFEVYTKERKILYDVIVENMGVSPEISIDSEKNSDNEDFIKNAVHDL